MDNAVLVSGEQQNGSVIHIHTRISPLFFFFFLGSFPIYVIT